MIERSSDARGFSEHSESSVCVEPTRGPAPVCFARRPVKWMPTIVCSLSTPRLEDSAPSICSRIRLRRTLTLRCCGPKVRGHRRYVTQLQPSPRGLRMIQIRYCSVQQRGHFRDEKQPILIVSFASQSVSAILYLCRTDKKTCCIHLATFGMLWKCRLWRHCWKQRVKYETIILREDLVTAGLGFAQRNN